MPSFLKIFSGACLGCSAWTYRRSSRSRISVGYCRMILCRRTSIPQHFPTSVGSCLPLALPFFVSDPQATARLPHNGEGVRLHSITPQVADNQGWVTIETVFIQLNTSLTPSGRFPAYWTESLPKWNSGLVTTPRFAYKNTNLGL